MIFCIKLPAQYKITGPGYHKGYQHQRVKRQRPKAGKNALFPRLARGLSASLLKQGNLKIQDEGINLDNWKGWRDQQLLLRRADRRSIPAYGSRNEWRSLCEMHVAV